SAKTYLEKNYEKFEDATLEELINHGLHALRETLQQDKELTNLNTSIGIVGTRGESEKGTTIKGGGAFRILQDEKVDVYLSKLEPKETGTAAPAPPGGDEDVAMEG
ncbi:hypothetical protein FRB90_004563, partial [Tulasnella sp. 427]